MIKRCRSSGFFFNRGCTWAFKKSINDSCKYYQWHAKNHRFINQITNKTSQHQYHFDISSSISGIQLFSHLYGPSRLKWLFHFMNKMIVKIWPSLILLVISFDFSYICRIKKVEWSNKCCLLINTRHFGVFGHIFISLQCRN